MHKTCIVFFSAILLCCSALKCWKCVGWDCDGSMQDSKFAEEQHCEPGAVCQVTFWSYLGANTEGELSLKPTRSCSFNTGCDGVSQAVYEECKKKVHIFGSIGCYTRKCCDTDLCNDFN